MIIHKTRNEKKLFDLRSSQMILSSSAALHARENISKKPNSLHLLLYGHWTLTYQICLNIVETVSLR